MELIYYGTQGKAVMEKLELVLGWTWNPTILTPKLEGITGGDMSADVRRVLMAQTPTPFDQGSPTWQLAEQLAHLVTDLLPEIKTEDFGGAEAITGRISDINHLRSDDAESLVLVYTVEYANHVKMNRSEPWRVEELPDIAREMVRQIRRDVQAHVESWFAERYGSGELDYEKWVAKKTEVFISYRGPITEFAMALFRALGDFKNRSLFIPRIDQIDLNEGDWLEQLMGWIKRCPVFIPILSQDYLEGPVAAEELHTALRQTYAAGSSKRIVPVLVEGVPHDYDHHFIGNRNMIQAQDDFSVREISPDTINKIAHYSLGVSMNEFE